MSKENEENKGVENQEPVSLLDDVFGDKSLPEVKSETVKDDPASLPEKEKPDSDKEAEQAKQEPKPKEEAATDDKAKEEADKNVVFQQQIKELENKLEASDKRVRDNQTSYHQEHNTRLELEKEIAKLKEQEKSDDDDNEFGFLDDDEPKLEPKVKKEKPVDVEEIKNDVATQVEEKVNQKLNEERWNTAETVAKSKFEDYDEVIDKVLLPALEGNPSLQAKFQEMGGTPEAAYELGKKVKDRQEYDADPDAYLERKIQEKLKSKKETDDEKPKPKIPSSSLSKNSAKVEVPGAQASKSPLDEVFG